MADGMLLAVCLAKWGNGMVKFLQIVFKVEFCWHGWWWWLSLWVRLWPTGEMSPVRKCLIFEPFVVIITQIPKKSPSSFHTILVWFQLAKFNLPNNIKGMCTCIHWLYYQFGTPSHQIFIVQFSFYHPISLILIIIIVASVVYQCILCSATV